MHRIVVISDTQIPYEDKKALRNVIDYIHRAQPDEVVQIGDWMDFPQPSRWSKDTRAEFEGSVFKDAEVGKKWLAELRDDYAGPVKIIEGNHDSRPADYLRKWAPALAESQEFDLDRLLDFDTYKVELIRGFYDFTTSWTMTHGHLGFSLSQIAGRTAQNAANKIGKSVVMGHTHRLARSAESYGKEGVLYTRVGVEVGHLMDVKRAGYLKSGGANWEKGFAVVDIDGSNVTAVPIPVARNGSFIVDGKTYGGK
ncbi:metallophosphoesterase [Nonomuraea sp. NPDC049141]|uniref:metallophosphoesterase family protein n=1 Tax=Nonomuraea sp. NPDC049141 TaxID=3155500 RepID=UPI0033DD3951